MDVTICEAPSQRLAFSKGATARRSAVRISVGVFNVSQTGRRRLLLMGAATLQDEASARPRDLLPCPGAFRSETCARGDMKRNRRRYWPAGRPSVERIK